MKTHAIETRAHCTQRKTDLRTSCPPSRKANWSLGPSLHTRARESELQAVDGTATGEPHTTSRWSSRGPVRTECALAWSCRAGGGWRTSSMLRRTCVLCVRCTAATPARVESPLARTAWRSRLAGGAARGATSSLGACRAGCRPSCRRVPPCSTATTSSTRRTRCRWATCLTPASAPTLALVPTPTLTRLDPNSGRGLATAHAYAVCAHAHAMHYHALVAGGLPATAAAGAPLTRAGGFPAGRHPAAEHEPLRTPPRLSAALPNLVGAPPMFRGAMFRGAMFRGALFRGAMFRGAVWGAPGHAAPDLRKGAPSGGRREEPHSSHTPGALSPPSHHRHHHRHHHRRHHHSSANALTATALTATALTATALTALSQVNLGELRFSEEQCSKLAESLRQSGVTHMCATRHHAPRAARRPLPAACCPPAAVAVAPSFSRPPTPTHPSSRPRTAAHGCARMLALPHALPAGSTSAPSQAGGRKSSAASSATTAPSTRGGASALRAHRTGSCSRPSRTGSPPPPTRLTSSGRGATAPAGRVQTACSARRAASGGGCPRGWMAGRETSTASTARCGTRAVPGATHLRRSGSGTCPPPGISSSTRCAT